MDDSSGDSCVPEPPIGGMFGGERLLAAAAKRRDQIKAWQEAENAHGNVMEPRRPARIRFPDGCVFLAACSSGDKNEVERLLTQGADVNTCNVDGLTALHQAVIDENMDMVRFLIDRAGANIDAQDNEGWTPLHAAASCGLDDVVMLLISRGADVAAINNDAELAIDLAESDIAHSVIANEMMRKGIDPEQSRRAEEQVMLEDALRWPVDREERHPRSGATALHVASAKGYIKVLNLLLQSGSVDVNSSDAEGWTPLIAAAYWGQERAVEILVEEGLSDMTLLTHQGQSCFDVSDDHMAAFLRELQERQSQIIRERPIVRAPLAKLQHVRGPKRDSVNRLSTEDKHILSRADEQAECETLSSRASTSSDDEDVDVKEIAIDLNDVEDIPLDDSTPEPQPPHPLTPSQSEPTVPRQRIEAVRKHYAPGSATIQPKVPKIEDSVSIKALNSRLKDLKDSTSNKAQAQYTPPAEDPLPPRPHSTDDTLASSSGSDQSIAPIDPSPSTPEPPSVGVLLRHHRYAGPPTIAPVSVTSSTTTLPARQGSQPPTSPATIYRSSGALAAPPANLPTWRLTGRTATTPQLLAGPSSPKPPPSPTNRGVVATNNGSYIPQPVTSYNNGAPAISSTSSLPATISGQPPHLNSQLVASTQVLSSRPALDGRQQFTPQSNRTPEVVRLRHEASADNLKSRPLSTPVSSAGKDKPVTNRQVRSLASPEYTTSPTPTALIRPPRPASFVWPPTPLPDESRVPLGPVHVPYSSPVPRNRIAIMKRSLYARPPLRPTVPPWSALHCRQRHYDRPNRPPPPPVDPAMEDSEGSSLQSTTSTSRTTAESNDSGSFIPPHKDSSESERKAHARRQREARRSTQGVTPEMARAAGRLVSSGDYGIRRRSGQDGKEGSPTQSIPQSHTPPPPPTSGVLLREKSVEVQQLDAETPPATPGHDQPDSQEEAKAPREPSIGVLLSNAKAPSAPRFETQPAKMSNGAAATTSPPQPASNIRRRSRQDRRLTGPVDADMLQSSDDQHSSNEASSAAVPNDSQTPQTVTTPAIPHLSSAGRSVSTSRVQSRSTQQLTPVEVDYKKLYEEERARNEQLEAKLKTVEGQVESLRRKLHDMNRAGSAGAKTNQAVNGNDFSLRRNSDERITELEAQIKGMEQLRTDNQKLKEENGALIRVISKLSK